MCGNALTSATIQVNSVNTGVGTPCGAAATEDPTTPPVAAADANATTDPTAPLPSPATAEEPLTPSPDLADTASPSPSPAVLVSPSADTPVAAPGAVPTLPAEEVPSAPAAPPSSPKAPVQIATLPICACATRGYGSKQCQDAWAERCRGKPKESDKQACASYEKAGSEVAAASAVSKILAEECFNGQSMTMDPCVCMAVSGCSWLDWD
jgi:hypothetical protein